MVIKKLRGVVKTMALLRVIRCSVVLAFMILVALGLFSATSITVFAQDAGKIVFTYKTGTDNKGVDQTWTVPAGVTRIKVKAWGAGGAGGNYLDFNDTGGGGGFVTGTLNVTPGDQLTIIVGGGGQQGAGLGAYGDGGGKACGVGGRGGGRSAIRTSAGKELITAGAGGGGGGSAKTGQALGGGGGGLEGTASTWPGINGEPGTQMIGGAGGHNPNFPGADGSPGAQYLGGDAGCYDNGFNGSGGSGYFGGGGGTDVGDGSGGGGSSFVPDGGNPITDTISATNDIPGNNLDPDYNQDEKAGLGGQKGNAGNPGRVVIIPVPIRIRRVDFTDNLEVQLDRFHKPVGRIKDFGSDEIEWKDDNCDAKTEKNWPVAYAKNSKIGLNIELCVEGIGKSPITVDVRGETQEEDVRGLAFEKKGVILDRNGTIGVGPFEPQQLPDKVNYVERMHIKWTITIGDTTLGAGTSSHNLYTLLREPGPQGTPLPIYFTILYLTTHGAKGATTEQATIDGIANVFKSVGSKPPMVHRWDYNQASGEITQGRTLQYWNEVTAGQTLHQLLTSIGIFNCPNIFNVAGLLTKGQGQCHSWADLLKHAFENHGIQAASVFFTANKADPICPSMSNTTRPCIFLVNNWDFSASPSGSGNFPYKDTDLTDTEGVPAQNVANPPPHFRNHSIVKVTTQSAEVQFYDPSYGLGPYTTIDQYENAAMAGFCKPVQDKQSPYYCQKNPPGLQLATPTP